MATVAFLAMAGCHLSECGEGVAAGERERLAAETVMITKPARAVGGLCPTLVVAGGQALLASSVATQPPYHADNTGVADAAAAIQRAIDAVAAASGGVVYLPAGRYRLDHPLRLGWGVTLSGEPVVEASSADSASATWLLAYAGRGDEAAPALIALPAAQETGLLNLTIAYPEQRAGRNSGSACLTSPTGR
jgi:hypothetical protein